MQKCDSGLRVATVTHTQKNSQPTWQNLFFVWFSLKSGIRNKIKSFSNTFEKNISTL